MVTNKEKDVRTRLMDAALAILKEAGLLALTQPAVARRAGVKQGHLTYYFPSRRDLLTAVAVEVSESLLSEFDAVAAAAADLTVAPKIASGRKARERTRLLLSFVLAADEEPEIRDMFRELTRTIRARLGDGLGAAGLPNDTATLALVHALCVGLAVLDLARREEQEHQSDRRKEERSRDDRDDSADRGQGRGDSGNGGPVHGRDFTG